MPATIPLERKIVPLSNLLLDPNNPRFFELRDWKKTPDNLFALESVQNLASLRLEGTQAGQIEELRDSIKSNGYINAETIVVKPYPHDPSYYIVIEGNRRLTALKGIVSSSVNPDTDELVQSIKEIEVLVYSSTGDDVQDRTNEMILQGIRHISGPKEWGAFQKANLIVRLHDEQGQNFTEIGQRLALGSKTVGRYYRAFKALAQMRADDEYSREADTQLFSLFDEAIKSAAIRNWLSWSDADWRFNNQPRLAMFYGLLVGSSDGDGDQSSLRSQARITNPQDMRHFGEVLMSGKETVLSRFLEGEIRIEDAARLVKPEPIAISLRDSLTSFLEALSKHPAEKLPFSDVEIEMFDQVRQKMENLRNLHLAIAATAQAR